jgi:hypothetical protein
MSLVFRVYVCENRVRGTGVHPKSETEQMVTVSREERN